MTNRLSTLLATLLIFGASIAPPARALPVPLTLLMMTDTLLFGRAILFGERRSLVDGFNLAQAKKEDGSLPEHWQLEIFLHRFGDLGLHIRDILGRHTSRPPPHPDEGAFGPLLALSRNPYADLVDEFDGELVKEVRVLHDRPLHFDVMTTTCQVPSVCKRV